MEFSFQKSSGTAREIEVTILPEELASYEAQALEVLRRDVAMEGFRKGHAPKEFVKEQVGAEQLFAKTAQVAVQKAYEKLIKDHELEVLGQPEVRVKEASEGKPFVFTIHLEVLPEVTLPDYKKIAGSVERKAVDIAEGELASALTWLKESRIKEGESAPELNDEFAKSIGNFENSDALKASVKEGLHMEKEMAERQRLRQEIVEKVAEHSSLDIPLSLVEREKEALLAQTKQGVQETLQIGFEEYLAKLKKSEQELKESLAPQAERRIKQFLVLHEIARKEHIAPSKEEIESEMNKVLSRFSDAETAKRQVDLEELYRYTEGVLQNEKTLQLLEGFAK